MQWFSRWLHDERSPFATEDQVRRVIEDLGDITRVLADAEPKDKAKTKDTDTQKATDPDKTRDGDKDDQVKRASS